MNAPRPSFFRFPWPFHALLLIALSILSAPNALAGLNELLSEPEETEFLPVEQAFPISIDEQSDGQVHVRWHTPDGYYLYKRRIYIKTDAGARIDPSQYSQTGKQKQDEAFGLITAFYGALEVHFNELPAGNAVLYYQGCADAGLCYPPQKVTLHLKGTRASTTETNNEPALKPSTQAQTTTQTSTQSDHGEQTLGTSWFQHRSWLTIVGVFFILGLGLTFTPCVLPMVPILTSVVLGQSDTGPRKGFLLSSTYVAGMALTYASAGLAVGLLGAGANVQSWMQTPLVLGVFAALFVALALAMFGVYELQLPSALRDRLNTLSQRQKGGQWLGVFIMGALSALIVSPCVSAPLAGALVYLSTTGDAVLGGTALLALGLGMGTPLIILGTTGASLLPKAGAWMERIKHVFGVLLLGVAIWLLGRMIPAQLTLLLAGALVAGYGISLGALEHAASQGQRILKAIGWVLLVYGTVAMIGAYMGSHDPLAPLSTPSTATHNTYQSDNTAVNGTPFARTASTDELNQLIQQSPKPVMVDIYADWCISCKTLDEHVFKKADTQAKLEHLTWLQLDVTEQTDAQLAFMKAHGVFGPPSIVFFERNEERADLRLVGEPTAAQLIRNGQQLLAR